MDSPTDAPFAPLSGPPEPAEPAAPPAAPAVQNAPTAPAAPAVPAATPGKPAAVVWLGPYLPDVPLAQPFAIFKGGQLPEHLARLAAEDEDVAALLVPVTALAPARQALASPGSDLARSRQLVVERYRRKTK